MKNGGRPARVKAISGNTVTIDDEFIDEALSYGYTFRNSSNEIYTSTLTIISNDQATLDGELPNVGDLFVWGEVDKITTEWIVKSISPNNDLSAIVTDNS